MATPTLGAWIERRAAIAPDDVALTYGDERLTYAAFAGRVRAAAALLAEHGVRRGDRVAFHGGNEPAALVSLFATAALGAAWVPVHPARPADEVAFILADAEVAAWIRGDAAAPPPAGPPVIAAATLMAAPDAVSGNPADRRPQTAASPSSSPAAPASSSVAAPGPPPAMDDLAILAYTSGTTGRSRGVLLTHANLAWNVVNVLATCAIAHTDAALAAAPFTRVGGLGVTVLETLLAGGRVVIPTAADGATMLATIVRERVSVVFANPEQLEGMARAPEFERADLSSLRIAIVGGGLVHEALLRRWLARGVPLRHGYGLTEAAPVVTLLDERDAVARAATVGKAIGFVEIRAVRDDGAECAPGEIGELVIRGPNVTSGYWRDPGATAAARRVAGWWRTGDAGSIDAAGYVTHVDRVSERVELAGASVYPAAIDRLLYGAPGIADAAAVVVDHALVIAVVADGAAPPVAAALWERVRFVLPAAEIAIATRVVNEIPRNAAGKVLRRRLAEILRAGA